ncbi:chromosome partitioning protein ParA [Arthrobacter koreensis]|uniref:chromosome partitioning protein ParA n=2 Tax=Arthrobacter koreensis TaxID=199136 RepID=UPI001264B535|nr:chromosome partitioning protein ParA [Arthrobacter koreensis]
MSTAPAEWPKVEAIIKEDGTGEVRIGGSIHPIQTADLSAARAAAVEIVAAAAAKLGRNLRAAMSDTEGEWPLIIHADGTVEEADPSPAQESGKEKPARRRKATPTVPAEVITSSQIPARKDTEPTPERKRPQPMEKPATVPTKTETAPPAETPLGTPQQTRRSLKDTSFLVSAPVLEPATQGWRGTLSRLGFRMEPSAEELAEREDIRTVSQHWPGPRTVAVVNRKGGANKTPTVVMLSAILARYSGAATVAWDNNESQGTLGWRTEQGGHSNSVLDLIDSSQTLLSPSTNAAEIARFVHHQTSDKYDVLRSDENEEGDHEVTAEEVDIAHQVLTRYYRLIVMDSGNTARAANWRRMIHHTDQLVVPVTAIEDRAEAARLTLQTLESRGGHDADLAANAVVIVSESTDSKRSMSGDALKRAKAEAQRIADGFAPHVRSVVRIPYDPALVNGPIRYDSLQPATQRAWLAAAAAVARGF